MPRGIGIIEPVVFSEWEAPVVQVMKSDKKSLQLSGNYKLTVNTKFSTLAGEKSSTKLDMSQTDQQLVMEIQSCRYVVIYSSWFVLLQ